ncbi:MAG: metallophosphoesterase [Clostridiales bacterium]|nr:metallophosphoesterase [Clostridiales bacterium]
MRTALLIIIAAVAAAGAILLIWGLIEACCLKVTRDRLVLGKSSDSSSSDSPDLRILYFSDLHKEFCFIPAKRIVRIIREESASGGIDAVVFGGDIASHARHTLKALNYFIKIAAVCRELNIPFMAVTGNHDALADAEDIGMFPFDNMDGCIKYLRSRRDGSYIAFAGVKDTGRHDRVWYAPPTPSAGLEYKSYILLSHNPDLALHMPSVPFKVDAMISGHIHGGQIRTPFGLEFKLRHDELPYQGIISGLHEVNGIKLFISKGVGCVFLPLRIGARPEVNVIEVYS